MFFVLRKEQKYLCVVFMLFILSKQSLVRVFIEKWCNNEPLSGVGSMNARRQWRPSCFHSARRLRVTTNAFCRETISDFTTIELTLFCVACFCVYHLLEIDKASNFNDVLSTHRNRKLPYELTIFAYKLKQFPNLWCCNFI